ncbi:MAG: DUF1674 domain-containing protein [Geminicoccaceae bacterium]
MAAKAPDKVASKTDGKTTDPESGNRAETDPRKVKELGGPKGPEPTRYGDWEKGGRCSDF